MYVYRQPYSDDQTAQLQRRFKAKEQKDIQPSTLRRHGRSSRNHRTNLVGHGEVAPLLTVELRLDRLPLILLRHVEYLRWAHHVASVEPMFSIMKSTARASSVAEGLLFWSFDNVPIDNHAIQPHDS